MTPAQVTQVRRLWKSHCGVHDIRAITGLEKPDIMQALEGIEERDMVRRCAERLLSAGPPRKWPLPVSEWPRVVRANFADVLGESAA